MQKFKLEIEIGNDAMSTWPDLAWALRRVAERLQHKAGDTGVQEPIWDGNGNRVGLWYVE